MIFSAAARLLLRMGGGMLTSFALNTGRKVLGNAIATGKREHLRKMINSAPLPALERLVGEYLEKSGFHCDSSATLGVRNVIHEGNVGNDRFVCKLCAANALDGSEQAMAGLLAFHASLQGKIGILVSTGKLGANIIEAAQNCAPPVTVLGADEFAYGLLRLGLERYATDLDEANFGSTPKKGGE